jgi:hypothetical protein
MARMANWVAPTDADIQRGIDAAMREVIRRDSRSNPNALHPTTNVRPAGAMPVVDGSPKPWPDEPKKGMPPGQDIIESLVNTMLPHGPKSKAK